MNPTTSTVPLRDLALRAWAEQQARMAEERRERIAKLRLEYRDSLRQMIEATLRVRVDLDAISVPLPDHLLEPADCDGPLLSAIVVIDGLVFCRVLRHGSWRLEMAWRCPVCGYEPGGAEPGRSSPIDSLEALGELLEHLPTLCAAAHPEASDGAA